MGFGNRARAVVVGEIDDLGRIGPLAAILRAAADQSTIDLYFNEREVVQTGEVRPFHPEIVDGNADLAESHLFGEILHQRQAARDRRAVDLDDYPVEGRLIRQPPIQVFQARRIAQKRDGKIDRDIDAQLLGEPVVPIGDRLIDDELRQRLKTRIAILRYEMRRQHKPQMGMAHAQKRFGAIDGERPAVDLRLVPKFEPIRVEQLWVLWIDAALGCGRYLRELKDTVAAPVTVTGRHSYCPDLSHTSAQYEGS